MRDHAAGVFDMGWDRKSESDFIFLGSVSLRWTCQMWDKSWRIPHNKGAVFPEWICYCAELSYSRVMFKGGRLNSLEDFPIPITFLEAIIRVLNPEKFMNWIASNC